MKKIDIKSFIIGLLVAVCLVLFVCSRQENQPEKSRYEIVTLDINHNNALIIDTYTASVVKVKFPGPDLYAEKSKEYIPGKKVREMLEKEE